MLSIGTQNEKLHKSRPKKRNLTKLNRAASTSKLSDGRLLQQSCSNFNLFSISPDLARWNSSNQFGLAPVPLVIAGPSGSGKSTLLKKLMEEFQDCFGFSVSRK